MDESLETILNDCIDALAAGDSLETVLARYPREAATLRPLLITAASLFELEFNPPTSAELASRRLFLQQAANSRSRVIFWQRFALIAASIVIAFVLAGGGLVWASQSTLPGDPLYRVKRAVERIQLSLNNNNEQLKTSLEERRRREVIALLEQRREAEVVFQGKLQQLAPNRWVVDDIPLHIEQNTSVQGQLVAGVEVEITGRTVDGAVRVETITVVAEEDDQGSSDSTTPQPSPTAALATNTPAPSHTATLQPTPTRTNTPTATVTPSPMVTPMATPPPPPTATPPPPPTATPPPPPTATPSPPPTATPPPPPTAT
ncbi:MAG: hypothetical protein D6823_09275, partial [Chloroflexi bacterium]